MTAHPAAPPAAATDLARLIETERRLEERLARAREEASRAVATARAAAAEAERALEREIEADAVRLTEQLEGEHRAAVAAIEVEARRAVATYDGVTDEAAAGLARAVTDRVLAAAAGGPR